MNVNVLMENITKILTYTFLHIWFVSRWSVYCFSSLEEFQVDITGRGLMLTLNGAVIS
jgi:hypothetical protein